MIKDKEKNIIIRTKKPNNLLGSFSKLFYSKYLLYCLVKKNIYVSYAQSFIGPLYFILLPLIQTIVFSFFLNNIFDVNADKVNSFIFILISTTFWNFFSNTVIKSGNSYLHNKHLISKVYFDRLIFFIQAILSSTFNFIINLFIMFVIILIFFYIHEDIGITLSLRYLFLPVFLFYSCFFALNIGIILASISVRYRDILYGTSFIFQLFLFVSPVLYSLDKVDGIVYKMMMFNPFTFLLEFFRWIFYFEKSIDFNLLIINLSYFVVLFFLANFLYKLSNYYLSDEI
jgi:lipopolysaccharide transport system permease protein